MSLRRTCDGCGARGTQLQERGLVRKCEFCPTCIPVVDAYLAAVDHAHDCAATVFRDMRADAEVKARSQGIEELPL